MKKSPIGLAVGAAILLATISNGASASDDLERLQVIRDPITGELIPVEEVKAPSGKLGTGGQMQILSATQSGIEDLIVIKTLKGLREANLPAWLTQDVLNRKGFSNWSDVPEHDLETAIAPITINLSAIRQIESAQGSNTSRVSSTPASDAGGVTLGKRLAPGAIGGVRPQGFCLIDSGKWSDDRYTKSYTYAQPRKSFNENKTGTYFNGSVNASFEADGQLSATINYRKQSKCGVTYEYEFSSAEVAFVGDFNGSFLAEGEMAYEKTFELWRKNISLLNGDFDFNSGYVNVEVEYAVNLELALDAAIKASATASLDGELKGAANVVYRCYENKPCETIKNEYSYSFDSNDAPLQAGVEVKASLTPRADLNLSTDIDLYWGVVQVLKGEVGIVGALPITAWGYAGNTCSDITGDGRSDYAEGLVVDVAAEAYAYFGYSYLDKSSKKGLDIPLSGFARRVVADAEFDGGKRPVRVKNLFYKDLLGTGKSTAMQPVVTFPASMGAGSDLKLGQRSCYPFGEKVTHLVQWADGREERTDKGMITIPYTAPGNYTVKVKTVADAASRSINSGWTQRTITIAKGAAVNKVEESTDMDWLTQGLSFMRNAWALDYSVHMEGGALGAGQASDGWHSAHWDFKAIDGGKYVKITNRWRADMSLHMEAGKLEAGKATDGWWSAHWIVEPVPGVADTYRLRNRWHPESYLNIEDLELKASEVPQHYMSSWWRFPKVK